MGKVKQALPTGLHPHQILRQQDTNTTSCLLINNPSKNSRTRTVFNKLMVCLPTVNLFAHLM